MARLFMAPASVALMEGRRDWQKGRRTATAFVAHNLDRRLHQWKIKLRLIAYHMVSYVAKKMN
jgi:hypothetical protein